VVHETAREFLLKTQLDSEFAVKKVDAHTSIAGSCLRYLSSDEMRPPRTRNRGSKAPTRGKRSKFALYTSEAFSYHLAHSDPSSRPIFQDLHTFLKLNVLSWIEAVAQTHSLTTLIRTTKHLSRCSDRWAIEHSPLGPEMKVLRCWSTHLVRIAAKLGDALISSASAIYWLIAPFCPVESAISQIPISGSRLSLVGVSNEKWDDRLACIDFHGGQSDYLISWRRISGGGSSKRDSCAVPRIFISRVQTAESWRARQVHTIQAECGSFGDMRTKEHLTLESP
jgi:hypothetical protein